MSHSVETPDLPSLLRLEPCSENLFRSLSNERNINGRVYGGQLMGQIVAAAATTVDAGRPPTVAQIVFLQGPRAEAPIDYHVVALQDGARFSSRHVRAVQAGRFVCDAHVSFQVPAVGPEHQSEPAMPAPAPETLPLPTSLDRSLHDHLISSGYIGLLSHPFIDYRFINPERMLFPETHDMPFRLWLRVGRPLPDDPSLHVAALAYLSDWWLNYVSMASHLAETNGGGFYVASLNHSIWFHAPCRADEWLLMVARSPRAGSHRALSTADLYTQNGLMVASVAQQSLLVPREPS